MAWRTPSPAEHVNRTNIRHLALKQACWLPGHRIGCKVSRIEVICAPRGRGRGLCAYRRGVFGGRRRSRVACFLVPGDTGAESARSAGGLGRGIRAGAIRSRFARPCILRERCSLGSRAPPPGDLLDVPAIHGAQDDPVAGRARENRIRAPDTGVDRSARDCRKLYCSGAFGICCWVPH